MATDFASELKDAAKSNDVSRIQVVLRFARACNEFDQSLLEAGLFESARHGCEDAARHLLSEGAGFITAGASMVDMTFRKAVQFDQVAIARLMLDAVANLNATDEYGWSALLATCDHRCLEMVNLLLSANADCNLRALDGVAPLPRAVDTGDKALVGALVKQQGLSMRDNAGNHIFLRAASSGRRDIAELLTPHNYAETLPSDAIRACEEFRPTGISWFPETARCESARPLTIYDLLYRDTKVLPSTDEDDPLGFRWINFPAHNPAWIEVILIKWYMETDQEDIESLKGLLTSLNNCHQGQYPHSKFHQPSCQVHGKHLWVSMPYLSFETVSNLEKMQETIQRVVTPTASDAQCLHIRRTLDPFFYPNFDTKLRDRDQVVYRYQERTGIGSDDPKLYMVDQLWILILDGKQFITTFPGQRLDRGRPGKYIESENQLNVESNVLHHVCRFGIRDAHTFVTAVTDQCCGMFDRHVPFNDPYKFLSMFQASVGIAAGREAELSSELWSASAAASSWLKSHGQGNREQNPQFLDKFLDLGPETTLLAEVKDIRDELNMLSAVLESQQLVLAELGPRLFEACGPAHDAEPGTVLRKLEEQCKLVEAHLKDLQRLDRQAAYVYDSASRLLDLKQKHANPFEARLAREQAAGAARTGKSVMIFTIITIIFLSISFITSFFTIEIAEFPRAEGSNALQLSFVMKYIFGVGFAVSIPLIVVAFVAQDWNLGLRGVYERFQDWRKPVAPPAESAPIKEPEALSV
ncbi:hypothetical protein BJX68DRAFT_270564 [Aspergillus pseudodeflectus]|uniref:Ankyrin repeat-containing domain protein n=1 Tax=Aspergillus pseudodeflectus TaxID=176178 RepID=A0ABR4JRG5_9EURO